MWKLNETRVYMEKDSGWYCEPRKGTVELLDTSSSILHTAGRPSYRRDLTFVTFSGFSTDVLPLVDDDTVTLEDDLGNTTSVSILNFKPERLYDYKLREIHRCNITVIQVD